MNNTKKFTFPDIRYAAETLAQYKRERKELEERMSEENRVWRSVYSGGESSSWIFNSILNKHADIIDSIPTCVCLPRERCDEEDARILSKIIPVITERADFEQTYSDNSWEKLKHGTAVYGVFWNNALEDGLGDIDLCAIPMESIYWEMGVCDVQASKNLFITGLEDIEALEARYPHFVYENSRDADKGICSSLGINAGEGRAAVVDWYYKKYREDGVSVLHYCKFSGDCILYCSENDKGCGDGWYHHGLYPVVFDRMYPCESGACGFGLISIGKDAQNYINRLDENIINYSDWASRVRFWAKRSLGVNEKDFLDLKKSIVEVEGDIDEEKLRQIDITPIDGSVIDVKRLKIEELKEITGSRDVSQGGISGSVTAASAISILREAGAKSSRDNNEESYRAYIRMMSLVIELIHQFYDTPRVFRIIGECGEREYLTYDGKRNKAARRPHFDIEVSARKKSPTESEQKNSFAKSLYDSGAFKSENVNETLLMLSLMDFDGVGSLKAELKRISEKEK